MKPFDYYQTVNLPYPDRSAYRQQLVDEIDSTPMTAAQRTVAINELSHKVAKWVNEQAKTYRDRQTELVREFWRDCRAEFGYDQFLDDDGVSALEAFAWEHGHSAGYSEVYTWLSEIIELAKRLVKHRKSQLIARG